MIRLEIDADHVTRVTVSTDSPEQDRGAWARLRSALMRGTVAGSHGWIAVRLDVLLAELAVLRDVKRLYGVDIEPGEMLRARLELVAADRLAREAVTSAQPPDDVDVADEVARAGFTRLLKQFQVRNLAKLLMLPHAADFSVPGAGKTSVALANYAVQRLRGRVQQALVVAPLSAFATWADEAEACFEVSPKVAVLTAGSAIPATAEIVVTNYHRLHSEYATISSWVAKRPTHVILDEAHRMKRGRAGQHGRAALDIAYVAARRDILTGTPAPQGAADLVALMTFLYPGQARQILPERVFAPQLSLDEVVLRDANSAISRYFVRTRKCDLQLPRTEMTVISRPMGPLQAAIYAAITGSFHDRLLLSPREKRDLRRLGQVVMYLLEAATNPLLLPSGSDAADPSPFQHPPLPLADETRFAEMLGAYGQYEYPWKYAFIKDAVGEAAALGQKTIVWTNFVRNIRLLEQELSDFSPAVIHGGIPSRDIAAQSAKRIREDELDRFRHDPECAVLLANPAAAGEGISLHLWCHSAIYLDRTFNAGHFLQSQDRIHRLGLPDDVVTKFVLLESETTIDEAVEDRLRGKVSALSVLMDDPGLVSVSLPDDGDTDADDNGNQSTFGDDTEAILSHLGVSDR